MKYFRSFFPFSIFIFLITQSANSTDFNFDFRSISEDLEKAMKEIRISTENFDRTFSQNIYTEIKGDYPGEGDVIRTVDNISNQAKINQDINNQDIINHIKSDDHGEVMKAVMVDLRNIESSAPKQFDSQPKLEDFILNIVKTAFTVECEAITDFISDMENNKYHPDNSVMKEQRQKNKETLLPVMKALKIMVNAACEHKQLLLDKTADMKSDTKLEVTTQKPCTPHIIRGGIFFGRLTINSKSEKTPCTPKLIINGGIFHKSPEVLKPEKMSETPNGHQLIINGGIFHEGMVFDKK